MPRYRKNTHLPPRVYSKHGAYYFVPKPQDQEKYGGSWIRLASDLPTALAKYASLIETAPVSGTLAEVWTRYERQYLLRNTERTQQDKRQHWSILEPVFGHCFPDDIQPGHIASYLENRDLAQAGVRGNREIATLSHMFTKAIRWQMATRNPCRGVERNPERTTPAIDVSSEMLRRWIEFAPPRLGLFSQLAFMTGLRLKDIRNLRFRDIQNEHLTFTASKTGKQGLFPLTEDLKAVLDELKTSNKRANGTPVVSEYVFANQQGRAYTANGFGKIWGDAMRKFAEQGGTRFGAKDLRAAHAAAIDELGGNATRNLQHSSLQVTRQHYLRRPQTLEVLSRAK